MGQKSNPIGLRLQINRTWDSRWYASADYARMLHEDLKLRKTLRDRLKGAGVSRVVIERPAKKPRVRLKYLVATRSRPPVPFIGCGHFSTARAWLEARGRGRPGS